jgi:hypothetical protein
MATRGVIFHIKHNLSEGGKPIGYELDKGRFFWTGESHLTVDEVLNSEDRGERLKIEQAEDFLNTHLADGPKLSRKVIEAAKREGIKERTLRRAKVRLEVEDKRFDYQGPVYWCLAKYGPYLAKDGQVCKTPENDPLSRTHCEVGQVWDTDHSKHKNNKHLSILDHDGQVCGEVCGQQCEWPSMEGSIDGQIQCVEKYEDNDEDREVFSL